MTPNGLPKYTHIAAKRVPINDAPNPQKRAPIRGKIASFFGLIGGAASFKLWGIDRPIDGAVERVVGLILILIVVLATIEFVGF